MLKRVLRRIKRAAEKVLIKLGLKEQKTLTKEEQWRARGVTFGENFDGPDSAIDYCFGHLVTIGDNVVVVQGKDTTYRVLYTFDEYIENQRKALERLPVSDTLFSRRSEDQWKDWKQELLKAGGGFDL